VRPAALCSEHCHWICCLLQTLSLRRLAHVSDLLPSAPLTPALCPQCLAGNQAAACLPAVMSGMQAWEVRNNCPASVVADTCIACLKAVPGRSWMCGNCAAKQQGADACFQCLVQSQDQGCLDRQ
jgi:hypothetical protein